MALQHFWEGLLQLHPLDRLHVKKLDKSRVDHLFPHDLQPEDQSESVVPKCFQYPILG